MSLVQNIKYLEIRHFRGYWQWVKAIGTGFSYSAECLWMTILPSTIESRAKPWWSLWTAISDTLYSFFKQNITWIKRLKLYLNSFDIILFRHFFIIFNSSLDKVAFPIRECLTSKLLILLTSLKAQFHLRLSKGQCPYSNSQIVK